MSPASGTSTTKTRLITGARFKLRADEEEFVIAGLDRQSMRRAVWTTEPECVEGGTTVQIIAS
jgi:hypothetical protein